MIEWIEAAKNGSEEALGRVLEWCRPYLLRVANEELATDLQGKVGASPSALVRAQEQDEALRRAMAQLPETYRQVVEWRNYDRCWFEEIGRRLKRSSEAARKLWVRAIEQLTGML